MAVNAPVISMILEAARRYIAMGYSVIPLKPNSKEPLIKWQEFTQRKATDAELLNWFGSGENNIGLVAGTASGFVVVDVDGPEGLESAAQLSLGSSTIALTGKGKQFLFRLPATPLRNAVRLMPGIDIRSDGGYICAPPSIHPNGKRYVWLTGPSSDLPEFPNVLASIARDGAISRNFIPQSSKPQDIGWVTEALQNLAEGNRNDTFARVVGKLHHSRLDRTTIWTLLLPYARSSGLEERELNSIIQSITRYPTEVSAECSASSAEQFLSNSVSVSWICDPICARGSIGFAAGLPESYKTWVLMDMAIECARGGGLWLGLFPIMGGRVLFIDQERARSETQRRFNRLLKGKSLSPVDLKSSLFIRAGTSTRLNLDESFNALKRELSEIRPDLILIDSFRTFHTLNVNSSQDMQIVMERVKEIRNEFGCAIIFVDHNNKSEFQDIRDGELASSIRLEGAIAKSAAAESVLTVRRTDSVTCMGYHTKSTLGPRVPSFAVHVMDTPEGGVRVYGEQGTK